MPAVDPSISVIIPTLNEVENIAPLISQIVAAGVPLKEIIFVDADSTDGTVDRIRSLAATHPIRVIEQDPGAPGLAAAITSGASVARGDLLVVMDADLSHPPEKINDLVAPLRANTADLVMGSRYILGGSTPEWPVWRRALSRIGSGLAYPLTGVHDSMCGFFAIRRARLLDLATPAIGFKIAFEIIVRGRPTLRIVEIPIEFRDRTKGRSKMSIGVALRFFWRWSIAVGRRLLGH